MNALDKMERKIGNYAIPRLPLIMTGCFIAGYIFCYFFEDFYAYLLLDPVQVVENHQFWRLITWIFTIPFQLSDTLSMLLTPICLYFYYYVGSSLEGIWGKLMLNFYIFGEILLTDIAVIVTYFVSTDALSRAAYGGIVAANGVVLPVFESTRYMLLSMFLAMAVIFKEQTVLFALVIPMRMKWMALIDAVFMLYEFIKFPYLYSRVVIIVCCVTFGIFWLINRNRTGRSFAQMRRSWRFKKAVRSGRVGDKEEYTQSSGGRGKVITMRPAGRGPIHQCTICGRTEQSSPDLEFRYCSKCAGNHEYCSDHIFTHVHIEESGKSGE